MEESRRALKQPKSLSPPVSEPRDVMEISQRAVDTTDRSDERQDTGAVAPLDLSRHSPGQPRTPPSGLTATTATRVGPVSPCQAARPPSRTGAPGVSEERGLLTDAMSQLSGSAVPAVGQSFTEPTIATQVTDTTLYS